MHPIDWSNSKTKICFSFVDVGYWIHILFLARVISDQLGKLILPCKLLTYANVYNYNNWKHGQLLLRSLLLGNIPHDYRTPNLQPVLPPHHPQLLQEACHYIRRRDLLDDPASFFHVPHLRDLLDWTVSERVAVAKDWQYLYHLFLRDRHPASMRGYRRWISDTEVGHCLLYYHYPGKRSMELYLYCCSSD